MEPEEYRLMYELEETHWWYRGLHDLVFSTIKKIIDKEKRLKILDVGCGTGFVLKKLSKYGVAFGVDISDIALGYCRKRGLHNIKKAAVSNIPFRDNEFDLVISLDVLYHKQVGDDILALKEMRRVLKKGGKLIVNLPAHNYLWRGHDDRVHTRNRYFRAELYNKLRVCKFEILKITYRNALLFIILLISGIFLQKNTSSDLRPTSQAINKGLYLLLKVENFLMRFINMPFGSSIFCIVRR